MGSTYEGWNGEFYVNCAHVNIIGPGGGQFKSEDFVKLPGAYLKDDPSMTCMIVFLEEY